MMIEQNVTAYLGLGANLGDRRKTLAGARQVLQRHPAVSVVASSPLYETAAVGGPADQPPYLNAVLKVETVLEPDRLLRLCLEVEETFGRRRSERWGPRTLDIDILLYGALVRSDAEPILPHPRLHERAFVLCPLVDLDPDARHPVASRSVRELLLLLGSTEGVQRVAELW